jgi:hypothetical protein
MQQLTDEERKRLCDRLRRLNLERDVGVKAADEIERLAKGYDQLANHCEHLRADVIRLAAEVKRLDARTWRDAATCR